LKIWNRYWSGTGDAGLNWNDDGDAERSTTDDVILRSLAGEIALGALTLSVDPSAALVGPCDDGATGVAGFAELHAYTLAASAHTQNIVYV